MRGLVSTGRGEPNKCYADRHRATLQPAHLLMLRLRIQGRGLEMRCNNLVKEGYTRILLTMFP